MERIIEKISNFTWLTNLLPLRIPHFLIFFVVGSFLASCGSFRQNIMFKPEDANAVKKEVASVEYNYTIRKNDLLQLEVFTNEGEKIVDPNLESFKETGASSRAPEAVKTYLVDINGVVKFPMINEIKVEGLTIRQA